MTWFRRVLFSCGLLLVVPALAFAQETTAPTEDLGELLSYVIKQAQAGNWTTAGVVIIFALTLILRKSGANFIPWFGTDEGGSLLGYVLVPAGILAAAAMSGTPITWTFVSGVLVTAYLSGAAWTNLRRVIIRLALPFIYAGMKKIPVLGTILVPFIERFFGGMLDKVRDTVSSKFGGKPIETAGGPEAVATKTQASTEASPELAPAVVEFKENETPGIATGTDPNKQS